MNLARKYILRQVSKNKLSVNEAEQMLSEMAGSQSIKKDDIAIIGMACKFPKSPDMETFWYNVENMFNCIDIPSRERRKFFELYYKKKTGMTEIPEDAYEKGGYFDEIDKFDAEFFDLSKKEADLMDPLQRIMLETVYLAIENAGITREDLSETNTSVYIGRDHSCESSYAKLIGNIHPLVLTGSYASVLSSRISHVFNLTGDSIVIDTACSSGLVSVHKACKAILNGESDLAIAGGINMKENLLADTNNPMGNILTQEGIVRTFDKNSQGTLLGEGAGAVILKSYSKALEDGDYIHAVIKGSASNNDGATSRISVPRGELQERVFVKAWEDAGINPETISYLEAHGTGTFLGDPIEIKAIKNAIEKYTDKKQFCAICTTKTNIGHTVAASGIASLLKAVSALNKKKIPGMINFSEVNPQINFPDSPVYVNNITKTWEEEEHPRRCGVSSFGYSGTNCHVVLEEAVDWKNDEESILAVPKVFTLSAKTETLLKQLVNRYIQYLNKNESDIYNVCYTSAAGRGHYEHRIAILVKSCAQLKKHLNKIQNLTFGQINDIGGFVYYGKYRIVKAYKEQKETYERTIDQIKELTIKANEITNSHIIEEEALKELCLFYTQGASVNWKLLYNEKKPHKVPLPVYPLERKSYWFDLENPDSYKVLKNTKKSDDVKLKTENSKSINSDYTKVKLIGRESGQYSESELLIGNVWGNMLGLKEINIYDSFFEFGGDSVLGIRIVNDLNKIVSVTLDVIDLLKFETIEKFAGVLDRKKKEYKEVPSSINKIVPSEKKEYYPLSSSQKRLFIVDNLREDTSYNLPRFMWINGVVELDKFEKIFQEIINRHESLRTTFEFIEGVPVQKIQERVDFKLFYKETAMDLVKQEVKIFIRRFDLKEPPLIRAGILKVEEEKFLLMIDIHHIVADRYSIMILINEFVELYNGRNLPKLKLQYKDFAAWQNSMIQSSLLKKQEEYWLNIYAKPLSLQELPTDYNREINKNRTEKMIEYIINQEITQQIKEYIVQHNVTLNMLLLTVFHTLLWKWTGQEDNVVGLSLLGRQQQELEPIIGMFVNTLALRNYPSGDKTFLQFMGEVKGNLLDAYANQDYPFEKLVDKLNYQPKPNTNPLFQAMFIMQNISYPEIKVKELTFSPYDFKVTESRFDLQMDAFEGDGVTRLSLHYCEGLYKKETVESLLQRFADMVIHVIEEPDLKLCDIEDMVEENEKLLIDFNEEL